MIDFWLAQGLVKHEDLLYVGSKGGMEKELVLQKGIPFKAITSGKLRRYFDWHNFVDPFKIIAGTFQAYFVVRTFKPDIVFSKGGFVSVPVVIGAWLNRIPVITHESDVHSGLANRIIGRFASKVCLTFPKEKYGRKEVLTGLPIREELGKGVREKGYELTGLDKNRPVLLVIGGSLGAQVLNEFIWQNLDTLLREVQIVHIVGKGNRNTNYELQITNYELGKEKQELKIENSKLKIGGYVQYEYVSDELPHLYAMADLILSRAGATVIAEIGSLAKPAILVPLTTSASRGEQQTNAEYILKKNAGLVVKEADLMQEGLAAILQMIRNSEIAQQMGEQLALLFPTIAFDRITEQIRQATKS